MTKIQVYKDRSGQYRWRLKAVNNEIVAVSEGYVTRAGAQLSAESLKRWAGSYTIENLY